MFTVSPETLLSMLDKWSNIAFLSLSRSGLLWAITEPEVQFDKFVLPKREGQNQRLLEEGVHFSQLYLFSKILYRRGILKSQKHFDDFKIKFMALSEHSGWFEQNILSKREVEQIRQEMRICPSPRTPKMQKPPEILFFLFTHYQEATPILGYRFATEEELLSALKFFDPEFLKDFPMSAVYLGDSLGRDFHIPRNNVYQVPHILLPA